MRGRGLTAAVANALPAASANTDGLPCRPSSVTLGPLPPRSAPAGPALRVRPALHIDLDLLEHVLAAARRIIEAIWERLLVSLHLLLRGCDRRDDRFGCVGSRPLFERVLSPTLGLTPPPRPAPAPGRRRRLACRSLAAPDGRAGSHRLADQFGTAVANVGGSASAPSTVSRRSRALQGKSGSPGSGHAGPREARTGQNPCRCREFPVISALRGLIDRSPYARKPLSFQVGQDKSP
jgi:hypothetical protein